MRSKRTCLSCHFSSILCQTASDSSKLTNLPRNGDPPPKKKTPNKTNKLKSTSKLPPGLDSLGQRRGEGGDEDGDVPERTTMRSHLTMFRIPPGFTRGENTEKYPVVVMKPPLQSLSMSGGVEIQFHIGLCATMNPTNGTHLIVSPS